MGRKLTKAQTCAASPLAFTIINNIQNENNKTIEFEQHGFLGRFYTDNSERIVAMKAAQIGFSTAAIIRSIHLARYYNANVIYTLPSKNVVKDFVIPKVNPLIHNNPSISTMVQGSDSTSLKQIGSRFVYFRGSWEETSAISISAHVLVNDELDRSNQKVLETYTTRLDAAKMDNPDLGWIWQFSNPSIPGYGVDLAYQKSDQKHWYIRCSRCQKFQYMRFPDNINFETKEFICRKCHEPLRFEDRCKGTWVPKYKDKDVSGYWFTQMMAPWKSARDIIEKSQGDQATFHNFVLGLPYISKDESVSREALLKCIIPDDNPRTDVAMGVDNGVVKTVVIGNESGIFDVFETESWDEVESARDRYDATMVIDALPYPAMPERLTKKYRGKVYMHYFKTIDSNETIQWGENDRQGSVYSDRTKIIDAVVADIHNQNIEYNMTLNALEQYVYDWGQLYKIIETNAKGISRAVWKTIEGRRDHYAFATLYWRIALQRAHVKSGVVRMEQKQPEKENPRQKASKYDLDSLIHNILHKKKKDWRR